MKKRVRPAIIVVVLAMLIAVPLVLWSPRTRAPSDAVLAGRLLQEVNKALLLYADEYGRGPKRDSMAALLPYGNELLQEYQNNVELYPVAENHAAAAPNAIVAVTQGFAITAYVEKSGRVIYDNR